MSTVMSFGEGIFPFDWFPISPKIDILKVDANFCNSLTWEVNRDFFEFNLNEFKGSNYRKKHPLSATSNQASWELSTTFSSPKVVFEEGEYEVEITAYGSPGEGVFPLMKLESVKWKNGLTGKAEIIGEWTVEKEKVLRSGIFNCQKGDIISFKIHFSNNEHKPNRQLYIKTILVNKKDGFSVHP